MPEKRFPPSTRKLKKAEEREETPFSTLLLGSVFFLSALLWGWGWIYPLFHQLGVLFKQIWYLAQESIEQAILLGTKKILFPLLCFFVGGWISVAIFRFFASEKHQ